jgi:hypothetical protein
VLESVLLDPASAGFALQLCTLRFLGFVPDDLTRAPKSIVAYLASQLGTDSSGLDGYAERGHTRTDHGAEVMEALAHRVRNRPR